MTHSPSIDLYKYSTKDPGLGIPPSPPSNVRGWLMGVPGYRDVIPEKHRNQQISQEQQQNDQSMTNNPLHSISNDNPGGNLERRQSISSIASGDSIDLDDLIKANYTLDVEDESDLPDLSGLDLDDSNENFWKTDKRLSDYQIQPRTKQDCQTSNHSHATKERLSYVDAMIDSKQQQDNTYIKDCHLDSPPDDHLETPSSSINIHDNNTTHLVTRARSGSINSDNSSLSYSTVTASQYSRYGMTPMIYQSDSTSTSSRTASRLSNYSTTSSQASSNTTMGLPRLRKVSSSSTGKSSFTNRDESHLLPRTHSRLGTSHLPTTSDGSPSSTNGRSILAQRASHIPSPSSNNNNNNVTSLPRLTSIPTSKSTGNPGRRFGERDGTDSSRTTTTTSTMGGSTTSRKLASRASHIPSLHERSSSPGLGNSSAHSTIRNSVFGLRRDDDSVSISPHTTHRGTSIFSNIRPLNQQECQCPTPSSGKSIGLRPPASTRSSSRIGLRKV